MPALGMAQETGTLIQWLKKPGDAITKGEPLMEIETDKATVEIEAPATGVLSNVTAQAGDVIPVGQRIALILSPGDVNPPPSTPTSASPQPTITTLKPVSATPIAARLAAEHNLDITKIKSNGGQIRKEDVLAYLDNQNKPIATTRILASPKARRLAKENGIDITTIKGTGPEGAVIVSSLREASLRGQSLILQSSEEITNYQLPTSKMWRTMADRLTQAWTTIPHFYLLREVNASRLISWKEKAQKKAIEKITYTDLLLKLTAAALKQYPRLNASWINDNIVLNAEINIGLAVAVRINPHRISLPPHWSREQSKIQQTLPR
jgi:pyruvate dehydrogenase E2 component (dihydrolipoamide acetyltransferase)